MGSAGCRGPRGAPRWGQTRVLIVWLSLWIQWSSALGSGADVVNATVGQTVTLTAPPVTLGILSYTWYRGPTDTDNELRIFSFVVSTSLQTNGPQFSGRETGLNNGSMQIRDVHTSDTRSYTVSLELSDGSSSTGTRQLIVYGRSAGLTVGAIAGIVIGVIGLIVLVSLVCILLYNYVKKKRASGKRFNFHSRKCEKVPTSDPPSGENSKM